MNKKQLLKHSLISIFAIFTILFAGIATVNSNKVFAVDNQPQTTVSTPNTQTESKQISSTADSIPEQNATDLKQFEKFSVKTGLVKFGFAMLGVLLSALIIYLGLKIYKKFSVKKVAAPDSFGEKNSLDSPKDIKEAINLFLDKTDN